MDNIAQPRTTVLKHAVGFASERSRALWWYVHVMAHWKCGKGYGCKRKSHYGHQIMFMSRGDGHGTYAGQAWTARGGDAVVMDLNRPHSYWSNDSNPWEMRWIIMDGPGVTDAFKALIDTAGSPVIPLASEDRLRKDFDALFALLRERPPGHEAWEWHHLSGLVANVFEGLRRARGDVDLSIDRTPEGIAAALAALRRRHLEPLSLNDLARAANMSSFHFARRFKRSTGFTPMEYLENFRISRAQELLLSHPDMRLKEIAAAVGYADPAYFSRVFRKRAGVSPRTYRAALPGRGL